MLAAALEQMDGIIAGNLRPLRDGIGPFILLPWLFHTIVLLPFHFLIFIYWLSPIPLGCPWCYFWPSFPFSSRIYILDSHLGTCLLIFRERESGDREKKPPCERETSIHCLLTWDWTCNLCMCLDQGSNLHPFGVWDDAPNQPSHLVRARVFLSKKYFLITVDIQYYFILVSGVQHSGQTVIQFTEWYPDDSSSHLAPYIVIRILLTIFLTLYFTSHGY